MSYAFVQGANQRGVIVGSTTLAYGSNNTLGNTLACGIMLSVSGASDATVSDSQGNHWQRADATAYGFGGTFALVVWYALDCAAGANTVTVTQTGLSGGNNSSLAIGEWSGVPSGAVVDTALIVDEPGACCCSPTMSYTLSAAGDLCIYFGSSAAGASGGTTLNMSNVTRRENVTAPPYFVMGDNFILGSGAHSTEGEWCSEGLLAVVAFKAASAPTVRDVIGFGVEM
jgi:hypothetical protein